MPARPELRIALGAGGNLRLVAALADGLPIFYNSVVSRIQHGADSVAVEAGGRTFKGVPPLSCCRWAPQDDAALGAQSMRRFLPLETHFRHGVVDGPTGPQCRRRWTV